MSHMSGPEPWCPFSTYPWYAPSCANNLECPGAEACINQFFLPRCDHLSAGNVWESCIRERVSCHRTAFPTAQPGPVSEAEGSEKAETPRLETQGCWKLGAGQSAARAKSSLVYSLWGTELGSLRVPFKKRLIFLGRGSFLVFSSEWLTRTVNWGQDGVETGEERERIQAAERWVRRVARRATQTSHANH